MTSSNDAKGEPLASRLSIIQAVRSDAFAGVERYICEVSNGLVAAGHRVVVIGGDPARVRAELSDEIPHHPATTVAQVAVALARQGRGDVIHVHMTAAETAAWLARPIQRTPIVATRHFPGGRGSDALAKGVASVVSRSLACDIAISKFVADRMAGPSVLLYNGVPLRPAAALTSPTVLMMQRLTVEKSPELGLRAWSASGLADLGWRLVVAGDGDLRSDLMALADTIGISGSVEFVGQIVDTGTLLHESSILLAPAAEEPFGLSVVEAMAHGLPVVAARGGAHVETLGEDGALFTPGDPDGAAKELRRLADSLALRLESGTRLRSRQQSLFSLEGHLTGLVTIYRKVVAG